MTLGIEASCHCNSRPKLGNSTLAHACSMLVAMVDIALWSPTLGRPGSHNVWAEGSFAFRLSACACNFWKKTRDDSRTCLLRSNLLSIGDWSLRWSLLRLDRFWSPMPLQPQRMKMQRWPRVSAKRKLLWFLRSSTSKRLRFCAGSQSRTAKSPSMPMGMWFKYTCQAKKN